MPPKFESKNTAVENINADLNDSLKLWGLLNSVILANVVFLLNTEHTWFKYQCFIIYYKHFIAKIIDLLISTRARIKVGSNVCDQTSIRSYCVVQ
jgi:hypothetical protein